MLLTLFIGSGSQGDLEEFQYFFSILIFCVWTNIAETHSHWFYMLVAYLWTGHEFGVKTQLKCVSMGLCLRIIKAHHSPAAYEGENSDKKGSSPQPFDDEPHCNIFISHAAIVENMLIYATIAMQPTRETISSRIIHFPSNFFTRKICFHHRMARQWLYAFVSRTHDWLFKVRRVSDVSSSPRSSSQCAYFDPLCQTHENRKAGISTIERRNSPLLS